MKCPYCGSERIEKGVAWGKTGDNGTVGLKYTRGTLWTGVAQVYSDLCLDCGAIVKSYVIEETNKEWSHAAGSRYVR